MNVFRQHNLLKAPPACVPSEDKVVTIVNGGAITSGSKLDVVLCVALRLCLYAVNTSEARTC